MFGIVGRLLGSFGGGEVKFTAELPGSDFLWWDVVILKIDFESLNDGVLGGIVKPREGGDEMVWELDGEGRHDECVIVTFLIIGEGTQSDRCILTIVFVDGFPEWWDIRVKKE